MRARCGHPDVLAGHVTALAEMLVGLCGERLDAWLAAVEADEQPDLPRFTREVRRNLAAVRFGLTMPHGRAGLSLLRKRVLLTA